MRRRPTRFLLLAGLLALGVLPGLRPAAAFPRGGGFHFGGAGYDGRGGLQNWQRGYQGYHPTFGPDSRPSWQDKGAWQDKGDWKDGDSWSNKAKDNFSDDTFQKQVNVNNNFYNRNVNGWNANWARGGYWTNRPWSAGWYAWTPATWGWWGWNSAGWGLAAGLATTAAITELVNTAANDQQTVIVVPGSSYVLNYASVEAVGLYGVSFSYTLGKGANLMGAANCQAGLLDGQVPATAAQAQLLNAVCQVAYGKGS